MALIDCPECGGQVSDRAPTCPHCGVPIVAATTATAHQQPASPEGPAREPSAVTDPSVELTKHETVEPFKLRLAGRPIPVAAVLFWGGMVLGVIIKYAFPQAPDTEPEVWRRLPWAMIWLGVLWFAVTEFGALMKQKLSKR